MVSGPVYGVSVGLVIKPRVGFRSIPNRLVRYQIQVWNRPYRLPYETKIRTR